MLGNGKTFNFGCSLEGEFHPLALPILDHEVQR